MKGFEEAIKNILPKAVVRGELEPRTMYYGRLREWAKTVQKNAQNVEVEFDRFKKDVVCIKRKKLQDRLHKREGCNCYLCSFIKELLGDAPQKETK